MNLLLITHDFPYGTAETFLETEIKYASETFEKVYVLSASQSEDLTRQLPENVEAVKATRKYKPFSCVLYALAKMLSGKSFNEYHRVLCSRTDVSFRTILKECFKQYLIEHRLYLKVKELRLFGENYAAYSYWLAEGAFFLAEHKGRWKRIVSRAHSYELWGSVYNPFIVDTVQTLDEIFFISQSTEDLYEYMLRRYKTHAITKSTISRLGIEAHKPSTGSESERFRIVSCSSIYPLKRLDLIIDALALVSETKDVEWIHFGGGVDQEKIMARSREKFKSDRLTWKITGWISNSEVLKYYSQNKVDLFVNMSDNEGIPVSVMEAISFGIPCMARDVGGNREIVCEESGYLLDRDTTPMEIARKIIGVIDSCGDRKSAADIYRFFLEHYCSDNNYQQFYICVTSCV